jgi:hypothetical protein
MKSIPVASVQPGLIDRIAADAVAHFGLSATPRTTATWMLHGPYSSVLCVQLTRDHWSQRFFAKLPRKPGQAAAGVLAELMRKEFELLRSLGLQNSEAGAVGTVEPLAYYPDVPSLVTIEAVGRTLRREYSLYARVGTGRRAQEGLLQRVDLCGQWLAGFHARTASGFSGFDVDELLSYCRVRLDRLSKLRSPPLSTSETSSLERAALAASQQMSAGSLRVSGRHNDFASHNIIASRGSGIRVLDFMAYDEGVNAFDVCNFWLELELLKFDPTYSSGLLSAMQSVFLGAYGQVDPSQPDFKLARVRYSLNRLLNEMSSTSSWRLASPRWHRSIHGIRAWLIEFSASTR